MTDNFHTELATAQNIAKQAGRIIQKYFDGNQQSRLKEDGTPVTIADIQINQMVIDELTKHFPDDGIIGEEQSTATYGPGRKWLCDPLDGTKAFTWGLPTSMFSLALVIDGQPVMGVAYDPYLDRMYTAVKGQGSFCNGQPLKVSGLPLQEGIVAVTSEAKTLTTGQPYLKELADNAYKIVSFSGAVYKSVLVARGKFVGYIEIHVNPHDMAAVELIVQEAGGQVTSLDGKKLDYTKPFKGAIASNGVVHQQIVDVFQSDSTVQN